MSDDPVQQMKDARPPRTGYVAPSCRFRGPYLPAGDPDWTCLTHDVVALPVDPDREGEGNLRREEVFCPTQVLEDLFWAKELVREHPEALTYPVDRRCACGKNREHSYSVHLVLTALASIRRGEVAL